MMYLPYITPYHSLWGARTIFARLQGEDKPSPLLCYEQVATSSIVGAMACPRPGAHAKIVRAPDMSRPVDVYNQLVLHFILAMLVSYEHQCYDTSTVYTFCLRTPAAEPPPT